MRLSVVCALLFLFAGCVGRGEDAHEPGERLGTFHLTGELQSDTCQAPVLGVTPDWQFDVKLSRDGDTLYWLNGQEAIAGALQADGKAFSFESGVDVTLLAARANRPGCVIERRDTASGKLDSAGSDVRAFELRMDFAYAPKPGAECAAALDGEVGFAALPCRVGYTLSAVRTAVPPSSSPTHE